MGTYKTMMEVPVWGDEQAEILQQAFEDISEHQDMLDMPLQKQELVFGCFCAIEDFFPRKERKVTHNRTWGRVSNDNPPPRARKKTNV